MRFILRVGVQTKRTQFIQTLQLTDLIIIIILLCVCVWVDAWMQDARQASAVPLVRYFFFLFARSLFQPINGWSMWWSGGGRGRGKCAYSFRCLSSRNLIRILSYSFIDFFASCLHLEVDCGSVWRWVAKFSIIWRHVSPPTAENTIEARAHVPQICGVFHAREAKPD